MTPHQPRVAVLGGGILAASVVAHLARAGARATLVARGALARGNPRRNAEVQSPSTRRPTHSKYVLDRPGSPGGPDHGQRLT